MQTTFNEITKFTYQMNKKKNEFYATYLQIGADTTKKILKIISPR